MKKSALFSLVLANLIPLAGIFFLDWNLFSILFFYWLESAVVGIYNIPRMALANSRNNNSTSGPASTRKSHKLSGIIFFIVHYSGFMTGHGFFIFILFQPITLDVTAILIGSISLLISHGVSFAVNFIGRKEYEKVSLSEQMIAPYKRIIVMHLTIMLCGFLMSFLNAPEVLLIFLVVLKIVLDVIAHLREHSKLGTYITASGLP
jgi:hypothetical protein